MNDERSYQEGGAGGPGGHDRDESNIVPLSRFQADLSRALSRRGKRLLEASDLPERVQALEPLEAYFIVKELGIEEAAPILRHCTPEQIQTFIDLDCWSADRPDEVELDAWLAPFAAEGPEALAQAFGSLEDELQVWFLRRTLVIHHAGSEDAIPDPPEGVQRKLTPDTFFLVEAVPDETREIDPLVLVEGLYATDLQNAIRLLTAAWSETEGPLEEELYRFRQARVESMGFPTRAEAFQIFGPPPRAPRPLHRPRRTEAPLLPAVYAAPLNEGSLLGRALARVTDPDLLAHLEAELCVLINHALVAHGGSPGSVQNATRIARFVRDTLSLGLEALISPDEPHPAPESAGAAEAASGQLLAWSLFEIHRFGHREVTTVQAQARTLVADPAIKAWRERTLDPAEDGPERADREFLDALLGTPPLYAGWDLLRPAARKAFGDKRETEDASARLDEIHRRVVGR